MNKTHAIIHSNKVRCRLCQSTIESKTENDPEVCSCGNVLIWGGKSRLARRVGNWGALEELSEYEITWQYVFDQKTIGKFDQALSNTIAAGYSFFLFDGLIYRIMSDGQINKTGKTVDHLNMPSVPCIVKVKS